jgi:transcriptional regulator with XRE-family HTH domain
MRPRREGRILESLAGNVLRVRLRQGLTQEQLAEASELTPRYIQQIERARVNPALTVFLAIADALEVTPATLLRPAKLPEARPGRPPRPRKE